MKKILFIFFLFISTFSSVLAQTSIEWAKNFGGSSNDWGRSIVVDNQGNVYTTGWFDDTADFDPGPNIYQLISYGQVDIFVTKSDSLGNFIWARRLGGLYNDSGLSIAVDSNGNVYTTGYFSGSLDFDPGPATFILSSVANQDIFVSKLDANGNFVWAKACGGYDNPLSSYNDDAGNSIYVDPIGNVYLTGSFGISADFDPGAGTYMLTASAYRDVFLLKLDSGGNFVFAKNFGSNFAVGRSITLDYFGNIYIAGDFDGIGDFDPGVNTFNLSSIGGHDIYVIKLDSFGDIIWVRGMGGTDPESAFSLKVDFAGNVFIAGFFYGNGDFDPGINNYNLTAVGGYDCFIVKLDLNGIFVWAKSFGGSTIHDLNYSLALDASGNIYTTGHFRDSVDFDPGPGVNYLATSTPTGIDIFLLKLDNNGNFNWVKRIGGQGSAEGYCIYVDSQDKIYLTGYFMYGADFDIPNSVNLISNGYSDIYIAKYSQTSTGFLEANSNDLVKIYPNPTNGDILLNIGEQYNNVEVIIFNMMGIELNRIQFQQAENLEIGINDCCGVYFLKISFNDKSVVLPVVVQ